MSAETFQPSETFGVICARCNQVHSGEFVTVGGRVLCKECQEVLGCDALEAAIERERRAAKRLDVMLEAAPLGEEPLAYWGGYRAALMDVRELLAEVLAAPTNEEN